MAFVIGVVSIVHPELKILLQHTDYCPPKCYPMSKGNRFLSSENSDSTAKTVKRVESRGGTDRADAGGGIHVDGVLAQVRLDLRQRPGSGSRHHPAAPVAALPAAAAQQQLLLLWLRYLYPQLLHRAMAMASTGGGRR